MRRGLTVTLTSLSLLVAGDALANGRYPQSNHVYFSESDPNLIAVRTTFGLLLSADHGHTFDWICEGAVGFYAQEDPMYTLTAGNRIVVAAYEGVKLSPDRGCHFEAAKGAVDGHVFVDLAARPGHTNEIAFLESSYDHVDDAGAAAYQTQLWATSDEATTITRIGPAMDPKLLALTVDLVASDPNRIYASGKTSTYQGVFLVSRDRGTTWESTPIPLGSSDLGVFIAGVDPSDANRVYLRTSGNASSVPARLIVARVGANAADTTVDTVFTSKGVLPGFAVSPDGKRVWIGGPLDGVLAASTTDFAFETRSNFEAYCLGVNSDGLWGCSTIKSGIVLGLSTDDGKTFTKRVDLCDVRGPLLCNGTPATYNTCISVWPLQRSLFGCPDPGTPVTPGGTSGSTGTTGPGAPSSNGGTNGGTNGGGATSVNGTPLTASGSGCSFGSSPPALGAVAIAALVALVRRRQRKSASA